MEVQMKNLVVDPILHLNADGGFCAPGLVIIDGLDECNGPEVQSRIVQVIARILVQSSVNLRFIIASRPESEIRKAFKVPTIENICLRVTLDESYNPNKDIEILLRSEFSAIKRTHELALELLKDLHWPSQEVLDILVKKSSGQFIYASTVMKFIKNDRHDPRDRLQTIITLSASVGSSGEAPYAPLDALYIHILSTSAAEAGGYTIIRPILQALLYIYNESYSLTLSTLSVENVAAILGIRHTTLRLRLTDLHSLVFIPSFDDQVIRFFHASFSDFLKDSFRSKDFYIAEHAAHITLGHCCLSTILRRDYLDSPPKMNMLHYSYKRYLLHVARSNFDDELLNELQKQDVPFLMSTIVSHLDSDILGATLRCMFHFNLTTGGSSDSAVPVLVAKLEDICKCFSTAVDQVLSAQTDLYNNETCIAAIVAITKERKNPNIRLSGATGHTTYYCWLALMLESPSRGGDFFLSKKRCEDLIHYIRKRREQLEKNSVLDSGLSAAHKRAPEVIEDENIAIEYLLERKVRLASKFTDIKVVINFISKCFPSFGSVIA